MLDIEEIIRNRILWEYLEALLEQETAWHG